MQTPDSSCCPPLAGMLCGRAGRGGAGRAGAAQLLGKLLVLTDTGWRGTRHTLTAHSPRVTRVQHAGEVTWGEVTASCYCCLGWVLIVPLRSPSPVCVYYRQSAAARRPGPRHPGSARRMRGARPGQLPRSLPPNFRGNYLYLGPRSCSSNHVTGGGL